MSAAKTTSLQNAVAQHIATGSSVAMGLALEALIPFAAGHEVIRQNKRELTLIGPISDMLFDQMIGSGCVSKVRAAWVGNVITGSGYNFRRAVENGTLAIEDHSNLTMDTALRAGAAGVSFMPTRTALGSDLFTTNSHLKIVNCPFTDQKLTAVAAIQPDVTIIHVQRCDPYGNAHAWGNTGMMRAACLAGRRIIVTSEEIVESHVIQSDPNRVIAPAAKVCAVVHAPWGAHPSPVPGFYNRDHGAFLDYRENSKTADDYQKWCRQWVRKAKTNDDYLDLLGKKRLKQLALKHHLYSEAVDYGY